MKPNELHIANSGDGTFKVFNGGVEPDWNSQVTLLIHGFNVGPQSAAESFMALFRTMKRDHILPAFVESRSWLIYWPGYLSGGLAVGKVPASPITYPNQIPSACGAAVALKRYLDARTGSAPINIIAHSLGCRVAMELLQSYANQSTKTPQFENIFLLAPAVPVYFLRRLQRFSNVPTVPKRVVVMCSTRDMVLQGAFRLGQTAAGEGIMPEAVGTRGKPTERWTRVEATTNSHSNYFYDTQTAKAIARTFGYPVPGQLPASALPVLTDVGPRALPKSNLPRAPFR